LSPLIDCIVYAAITNPDHFAPEHMQNSRTSHALRTHPGRCPSRIQVNANAERSFTMFEFLCQMGQKIYDNRSTAEWLREAE